VKVDITEVTCVLVDVTVENSAKERFEATTKLQN